MESPAPSARRRDDELLRAPRKPRRRRDTDTDYDCAPRRLQFESDDDDDDDGGAAASGAVAPDPARDAPRHILRSPVKAPRPAAVAAVTPQLERKRKPARPKLSLTPVPATKRNSASAQKRTTATRSRRASPGSAASAQIRPTRLATED